MVRRVKKTVLICCEGKGDKAFINYLKSLYNAGRESPPRVSARQSNGKGGSNVLATLFGVMTCEKPDVAAALLDADCPPSRDEKKEATRRKVVQVNVEPCLEGLLLKVLDQPVPAISADCKRKLKLIDPGELFDEGFFPRILSKALLDRKRQVIPELDALIRCLSE